MTQLKQTISGGDHSSMNLLTSMAIDITSIHPQFTFSSHEYRQLEVGTLICAPFSIFAAFLVFSMYCYLLKYRPIDANRVSLHCVITSITFSTLSQALNLVAIRSDVGKNFCDVFRVMDNLCTLISSCFLATVGVYLLLLFHFRIHRWPCRPEFILMPIALVYTVIGNMRSYIYDDTPIEFRSIFVESPHLCWYYVNLIDRLFNIKTWYYYYSFMFFIIVVSFFSSLFAMRRVYIDKVGVEKRLARTAMSSRQSLRDSTSLTSSLLDNKFEKKKDDHGFKEMIYRSIKRNSSPFSKIVLRSLLYPLTPCVVYIWGFGLQMYLIDNNHKANFAVVMISNLMMRLEGCFIAGIFFMDPTVLEVLSGFWNKCKSSFVSLHVPTIEISPASTIAPLSP